MNVELRRLQALLALKEAIDASTEKAGCQQGALNGIWLLAGQHHLLDVMHKWIEISFERLAVVMTRQVHHGREWMGATFDGSGKVEVLNQAIHKHDGAAK